jgi:DNA-directed RNA polymerase specialized sigma24 family protein
LKEWQALSSESIDWLRIYQRLTLYAFSLPRSTPDIFDGISMDDLVNETMLTFLESSTALGWDSERELTVYLGGVLKHKFLDHVRRQRRQTRSLDDPAVGGVVEGLPTTGASVLNELEFRQWIALLMAKLAPHKELQDVVDAAQQTDGSRNTNQQMGETLSTTPNDIANRKKRIIRILLGEAK